MRHNNLKLDGHVGDLGAVQIRASLQLTYSSMSVQAHGQVPGAHTHRDVVDSVLSSEIRLDCNGRILFEGSILELAVLHLRDLQTMALGDKGGN